MAVPTQTAMLYVHSDANAYACKGATKLYWIPPAMQVMVTQCLMMNCLYVECIEFWGDAWKAERYLQHVTFLFEASQVNIPIKSKPFRQNIIRNFTQERFRIITNWFPVFKFINRYLWMVLAFIDCKNKCFQIFMLKSHVYSSFFCVLNPQGKDPWLLFS